MGPIFNDQAGFPLKMGLIGCPEVPSNKLPIYTTQNACNKLPIYTTQNAGNKLPIYTTQNAGNKLPIYTTQNPRRAKISFILWWKPEITICFLFYIMTTGCRWLLANLLDELADSADCPQA